jgi:Wax ester synthase-like Acyl-CoA acyltransferase domain
MPLDRLTAEDRLMLGASATWPQEIGVLAILDGRGLLDAAGRLRIDAVRDAIRRRLHLVPRFRQVVHVPRRGLGGPLWVDAPAFDLRDHVRALPVAAPGGEAELLCATERLRRRRLDPSRPLWELWRRRVGGPQQGNLIAQMVVPLPLGEPDPGRRLRRVAAATAERKAWSHTALGTLFLRDELARLGADLPAPTAAGVGP